jgi:hypothetical protein
MTQPLPLPVRIALAGTVTAAVLLVRLLLGVGRLGLWLLALAGFRGSRLLALAATGMGVWWAAGKVGVRPAVWLAVIGWAAWAVRHHRAVLAQHAAAGPPGDRDGENPTRPRDRDQGGAGRRRQSGRPALASASPVG